jgi:hypothetical protein
MPAPSESGDLWEGLWVADQVHSRAVLLRLALSAPRRESLIVDSQDFVVPVHSGRPA